MPAVVHVGAALAAASKALTTLPTFSFIVPSFQA
jgi:hypothetical protein